MSAIVAGCAKAPIAPPAGQLAAVSFEEIDVGDSPILMLDPNDRAIVVSLVRSLDGNLALPSLTLMVSRRGEGPAGWTSDIHPLADAPQDYNAWIRAARIEDDGVVAEVQQARGATARRWLLGTDGQTVEQPPQGGRYPQGQVLLADQSSNTSRMLWVDGTSWFDPPGDERHGWRRHGEYPYTEVPARLGGDHLGAETCPAIPKPEGMNVTSRPFDAIEGPTGLWVIFGVRSRECGSGPLPCVEHPEWPPAAILGRCALSQWWLTPIPNAEEPSGAEWATIALDSARRPHVVISGGARSYYAWLPTLSEVAAPRERGSGHR